MTTPSRISRRRTLRLLLLRPRPRPTRRHRHRLVVPRSRQLISRPLRGLPTRQLLPHHPIRPTLLQHPLLSISETHSSNIQLRQQSQTSIHTSLLLLPQNLQRRLRHNNLQERPARPSDGQQQQPSTPPPGTRRTKQTPGRPTGNPQEARREKPGNMQGKEYRRK